MSVCVGFLWACFVLCVFCGVGGGLFIYPFPLKVQACSPWDQRSAAQFRIPGQVGATEISKNVLVEKHKWNNNNNNNNNNK